ncbi:MAG: peptidoglycan DD-metalloendopeptidase family protein, partial [Paludibacteraceae bacterium]|nr:peptidoglycan DD-metalloendopeptidase family protein [Paludibacteraceae bacterium]
MKRSLFIALALLAASLVWSQSIGDLQKQKKQALKKLETTSKLISETQKSKKATLNQVNLLQAEIKQRNSLIKTLDREIDAYNQKMTQLKNESAAKQRKLESMKKEYADLTYYTYYKKNKYRQLMFILSADRLDESIRRYRYIRQYAGYCRKMVGEIEQTKRDLDAKLEETETVRMERMQARSDKKKETDRLNKKKAEQDKMVNDLKKKEKNLKSQLQKQQKEANRLNSLIEKKIAEEARKEAAKKTKAAGGTTPTGTKKPGNSPAYETLTKEEKLVSSNFAANQGRLPWPTAKGTITGHYGIHPHPVLAYVTTNNKGIYIQCPKGTEARAVFNGEVSQRFATQPGNNVVIIKHGAYRTVYATLSSVYVKVGDKVTTKQAIGKINTDAEEGKTELYFQVWNEKNIQNPESWI